MAPHAIILLNDPPALLHVLFLARRQVEITLRILGADAAHQEGGQRAHLLAGLGRKLLRSPLLEVGVLRLEEIGHLQFFALGFHQAIVVHLGARELVLKESFVRPPTLVLRLAHVKREVELLERLAALDC